MEPKAEGELLLYCLGIETDEIRAAKLEQLSNSDWDEVIQQSVRHRVAPLLYHRFRTTGTSVRIPIRVMQRLREIYFHSAARNIRLYNELGKVLKSLTSAGIEVIVLKGAALASIVYQNITLRPMNDIDLLVRKNDLCVAQEKIMRLGYQPREEIFLSKWHEKKSHLIEIHPPPLYGEFTNIEVHLHLLYGNINSNTFTDEVWKTAQGWNIEGVDVFILSPEHLLHYLCTHLERHKTMGDFCLHWLCDIAETMRFYEKEINWEYLLQSSKKYRIKEPVYQNLYLAKKYLGAPIPANVFNELTSANNLYFENNFIKLLKNGTEKVQTQKRELDSWLLSISSCPSIHDKIYHVFRHIFPCREFMIHRYSVTRPSYIYFYYFIRISKVAVEAVKALYHRNEYEKMVKLLTIGFRSW